MSSSFDAAAWQLTCESLAAQAHTGCGLSYELFAIRFTAHIDSQLKTVPEPAREKAIQIARIWGYCLPNELAELNKPTEGFCTHGFPTNTCPLGCDDHN